MIELNKENFQMLSPDEIELNYFNVNQLQSNIYDNLKESLLQYGFLQPIIVRKIRKRNNRGIVVDCYEVLDGQHRVMIANEHKCFKKIPCIVLDNIDDEQAKALVFVFTHAKGEFNLAKSYNLLRDADLEKFSEITKIPMVFLLTYANKPIIYTDPNEIISGKVDVSSRVLATIVIPSNVLIKLDNLYKELYPVQITHGGSSSAINYRRFLGMIYGVCVENMSKETTLGLMFKDTIKRVEFFKKVKDVKHEKEKLERDIQRLERRLESFKFTGRPNKESMKERDKIIKSIDYKKRILIILNKYLVDNQTLEKPEVLEPSDE